MFCVSPPLVLKDLKTYIQTKFLTYKGILTSTSMLFLFLFFKTLLLCVKLVLNSPLRKTNSSFFELNYVRCGFSFSPSFVHSFQSLMPLHLWEERWKATLWCCINFFLF